MAFGGYPNELVESPPPELQYECSICLQVVRDPHMVSCCSLRFCRTCIERVQRQRKPCPHCQEESYTITRDSQLERVLQFKRVFCVNKKKGCEWVGELRDAERHVRDDCMWTEVDCTNKCGQQILRCKLDQHETEECPRRAKPCEFADMGCKSGRLTPNRLQSHLQESMQTHLMLVCQKLREERSVRITHQTELKDLEAKVHESETEMSELNIQVKTSEEQKKELKTKILACEKEREELKTTVQACTVERKELKTKVEACEMERKELRRKVEASEEERKELKTTVQACAAERKELKTKVEACEMERKELRRKVEASEVEGKELKTTVQVCKMEIRKMGEEEKKNKKCIHTFPKIALLCANVVGIIIIIVLAYLCLSSEVSSTTGHLETEWQQKLQTPVMNVSTFNETQQATANRWKREKEAFIHAIQTLNTTHQIQTEELQKELSKAIQEMGHFKIKLQQMEAELENQQCYDGHLGIEWQQKLQELAVKVEDMSTSKHVIADTWKREQENLIRAFEAIHQKQIQELHENLSKLKPQMQVKLQQIEIKLENQQHLADSLRKMMQEHMDMCKNEHQGVPAIHDQTTLEQFRTLSLALNEIAPQPIFIFPPVIVMENFEKHMNDNSPWFSSSFYTHIGGYKMCLKVYANGSMLGNDTHVEVGVVMMRGEFDDYLQWPFKGEVKVQLINQKEGGDLVEKIVVSVNDNSVNLHRVMEGDRALKGWGLAKFIAHSELYKPKVSKQYLKNDTLKFKINTVTVKSTADGANRKMHEHMDKIMDELAIHEKNKSMMHIQMDRIKNDFELHNVTIMKRIQTLFLALNETDFLPFISPPVILLENFEQHKKTNGRWFSPSFYTHVGGYKMCLRILVNGRKDGKGTHVGVSVFMMRGEFDDHLQWPFKGVVRVQLINQNNGGKNVEKIVLQENLESDALHRVLEGDRATTGLGLSTFIAHSDLCEPEKGKEYLKNDTLKFKVSEVTVKGSADRVSRMMHRYRDTSQDDFAIHEKTTRMMQKEIDKIKDYLIIQNKASMDHFVTLSLAVSRVASQPVFIPPPVMVLEKFEEYKRNGSRWYSSSFYTHIGGYKMCLVVNANGYSQGKNTYVSVFVHMIEGEFDDYLPGPFKGAVTVDLINQRKGRVNYRKVIVQKWGRAKKDRISSIQGSYFFIPHSELYDLKKGEEYLKTNTLIFKVVAVTGTRSFLESLW